MKTITSKFDSKCRKCRNTISAGSRVRWEQGKGAEHLECPVQGDFQFTLYGDQLRSRLAELLQLSATRLAVRADHVLEVAGEEPPAPCPLCNGTGRVTSKYNLSDTLDFSDWNHFVHPCGTRLDLSFKDAGGGWVRGWEHVRVSPAGSLPTPAGWDDEAGNAAFHAALALVPLAVQTHYGEGANRWYSWHAPGTEASTSACVQAAAAHSAWTRRAARAGNAFDAAHHEVSGLAQLVHLTRADLEVRRGDTATVINRNKPVTGVVSFIGVSEYSRSNDVRVTVTPAEGKRTGGAVETAVMLSRTCLFPMGRPELKRCANTPCTRNATSEGLCHVCHELDLNGEFE